MSNDGKDDSTTKKPEDEAVDAAPPEEGDEAASPDAVFDSEGQPLDDSMMVEMNEEQMIAMMREQQVGVIAALVKAFSGLDDATVLHISGKFFDQQAEIGQIIIDATDPVKRTEYPDWGVQVYDVTTKQLVKKWEAPKDFTKCKTPQDLLNATYILGLVVTPALRAILYANGYGVKFAQGRTSKLIYPKK